MKRMEKVEEIPVSIKPKTRPYTLEVYIYRIIQLFEYLFYEFLTFQIFYWGLRNVKDTNYIMLGQQKINTQIQIGDMVLESNAMDKCISNGNFFITHRKHEIVRNI